MKSLYVKICCFFLIICFVGFSLPGSPKANKSVVTPADDIQKAVKGLAAGDTLLFSEGTYTRKTALFFEGLHGNEKNPIVVGPAPGAHVTVQLDSTYKKFVLQDWKHNVFQVRNCRYLEIYGFEITKGRTGIETQFTNSHCTFRDLHIHHVGNVGIRIANGANSFMKCIGNHIHHTYMHGEGYYIGDNDGSSDINNCLFERNYIHHTSLLKDQGDGIELKKGCWGNTIRHNVFHDNNYPGILVWGTGKKDPRYNNKVYGNLVFQNTGSEAGIQVASECDVFNNIVFDGGNRKMIAALHSSQNLHSGMPMNNIRIYNNTFFGSKNGVVVWDWEGKEGMVFANNIIFCPEDGDEALVTKSTDLESAFIQGNYYFGGISGAGFLKRIGNGITLIKNPDEVFVNPVNDIALIDLYPCPGSILINNSISKWVTDYDFNMNVRIVGGAADVGAYEFTTMINPGWRLEKNHKLLPK